MKAEAWKFSGLITASHIDQPVVETLVFVISDHSDAPVDLRYLATPDDGQYREHKKTAGRSSRSRLDEAAQSLAYSHSRKAFCGLAGAYCSRIAFVGLIASVLIVLPLGYMQRSLAPMYLCTALNCRSAEALQTKTERGWWATFTMHPRTRCAKLTPSYDSW
jgi:hypothetical protein